MPKALLILAKGFEDIEAITVIDILRRADVQVVVAALQDDLSVESAHGVFVKADATLLDVIEDEFDVMILPGGGEGTDRLKDSPVVIDRLRKQKEEGRLIAAICAAPTVLVQAEVLDDDQQVTCYPTVSTELDRPCVGVPVVADRGIITGQAPGSAMLFALVIVQTLLGDKIANRVARGLVTDVM